MFFKIELLFFFSSIHTVVYKILADVKLLSDSLAYVKFYMRKLFYSGTKESVIYIFQILIKIKKRINHCSMLWNSQFFKSDIRFTQTKCAAKVAHDDRIKRPQEHWHYMYIYTNALYLNLKAIITKLQCF